MFKTAALAALVLLDDLKPKAESRAERYITGRVPMLEVVTDDYVPPVDPPKEIKRPRKKPTVRRKRHICEFTHRDLWATFHRPHAWGLPSARLHPYLMDGPDANRLVDCHRRATMAMTMKARSSTTSDTR
jgi:hypothetical protein